MTTIAWLHRVIVRPTVDFMADATGKEWIASDAAQAILLGIAAVESDLRYTRQLRDGPARSYWQVEIQTALDVIQRRRRTMAKAIDPFLPDDVSINSWKFGDAIQHSQSLGCMLARLKLMDDPRSLPAWHDVSGQAAVWKQIYNTHLGAGRPEQYEAAFARHGILGYLEAEFGAVMA